MAVFLPGACARAWFTSQTGNANRLLVHRIELAWRGQQRLPDSLPVQPQSCLVHLHSSSGASVKEAQALARHATPAMTMNVYGRMRDERLVQIVKLVGEMVSVEEKRAGSAPESADTTTGDEGYAQVFQVETGIKTMPKGGFEPPDTDNTAAHEQHTITTQIQQIPALVGNPHPFLAHPSHTSEHPNDRFLHGEYGICMGDLPDDLRTVIDAWESLPEAVKAGIVAMVNVARRSEQ